ncbi:MAG: hypothetical protein CMP48_19855 [Rickettsiales bacterium]|nr:hypothetical protein [Rickettsiales bacterium]
MNTLNANAMLTHITQEIKRKKQASNSNQRLPLVRYQADNDTLIIKESSKRLNSLHMEAIKTIIADHLNGNNEIDIALQLANINIQSLSLLFDLFKFCNGLQQWKKNINITWYMPLNQSRTKEIALNLKEIYKLNVRIFHIS